MYINAFVCLKIKINIQRQVIYHIHIGCINFYTYYPFFYLKYHFDFIFSSYRQRENYFFDSMHLLNKA